MLMRIATALAVITVLLTADAATGIAQQAASASAVAGAAGASALTDKNSAAPEANGATPATSDTVTVPVWPKVAVPLAGEQPVTASFSLGKVEGVDPKLVAGVTAKGYARKVAVEDQSVGQVLVVSVAKGDKEETLASDGLAAQFDAKETSELFPEKTVELKGSKTALVAALKKLAEDDKKDEEEKKSSSDSSSSGTVSSGTKNDEASSYRTPTTSVTSDTTSSDPTITVSSTTEGCSVRIDTAQGKAIQQSKEQTFSDGVLSSSSECTDSEVSYVLNKSYATCPDVVDTASMTAWPQYTLSYTDNSGETHTVSDCTKDSDSPYTISEDESQCTIVIDYNAGKAIPQSALVYTNHANTLVQARGCQASTLTSPITMTQSTAQCSIHHDFTAGLSYEMSMWTYIRDGVTYQAAPCTDDGTTFPHETVYTDDAGNYICTPVTNLDNKTVTLQSRKAITVGGQRQFITECTPDTTSQTITVTTDGCMDPSKWTHDIDAGVSYGQERYYYSKADGSRVYVTDCQTSANTYPQSQEVTGYQYHDDQLFAYPLMTVTITVGGSAYTIKSSEVLAGATQFVYVLNSTTDKPNGTSTYDGCNAYRATDKVEVYARPDGTEYDKVVGSGTPQGAVNVCSTTTVDSRQVNTGISCKQWSTGWADQAQSGIQKALIFGTVNKNQFKNTETGEIISSSCVFSGPWNALTQSYLSDSSGCPGYGSIVYDTGTITGTDQNGYATYTISIQTLNVPPCPF